jgi:hypothetical protein
MNKIALALPAIIFHLEQASEHARKVKLALPDLDAALRDCRSRMQLLKGQEEKDHDN